MKLIRFLLSGIFFGIILVKSEVISWYRIYEMFRFESFHMYGVIGSAVAIGIVVLQLIRRNQIKSIDGAPIKIQPKEKGIFRPLVGGTIFGLGWALTGACPGPIYVLIGSGFSTFMVVLLFAILGAFTYGLVAHKLPRN